MSVNRSPPLTLSDLERKYDSFYVPTFEIDIGGETQFSPAKGQASSVTVTTAIEKANRLSFSVAGVYDQTKRDFTGLADAGLTLGTEITVKLGYGGELSTIMAGKITDVQPQFPAGSSPTVKVVAYDHRYFMNQGSEDRSWNNETVESATRSIAQNYGFTEVNVGSCTPAPDVSSAPKQEIKQLVQDAESGLEFLRRLIKRHNYELFSREGKLCVRRPETLEGNPTPSVTLAYGEGLRSYQLTGRSQTDNVKKVTYRGTNPRTGETVSGSSERKKAEGADEQRLFKAPAESNDEAESRAKAAANEIDHARQGTATTLGLPDLRIGDWLRLTGLGSIQNRSYDGLYYLREVDHRLTDSGYTTNLTMSGPIPDDKQ